MSEETKQPTREEMITWFKDQIEIAELRATLSKHNRDTVVFDVERQQAIMIMAQMQSKQPEEEPTAAPSSMKVAE